MRPAWMVVNGKRPSLRDGSESEPETMTVCVQGGKVVVGGRVVGVVPLLPPPQPASVSASAAPASRLVVLVIDPPHGTTPRSPFTKTRSPIECFATLVSAFCQPWVVTESPDSMPANPEDVEAGSARSSRARKLLTAQARREAPLPRAFERADCGRGAPRAWAARIRSRASCRSSAEGTGGCDPGGSPALADCKSY